ncbi:alpha/beta hydrolase [Primorskyibacter sp. S187A]|uniref:alpha/beta hydrolase n=1 Tax=Primorskyibacter sp. S187A TaxID=3415130 RepID=UPI003C7BE741
MKTVMRWMGRLVLLVLAAIAGFAALAPREPVVTEVSFDADAIGEDLDAYLAAQEARFPDITPGTEKRVLWAGEPGHQTDLAVLYVHGFSATSEEIRPVPDRVAEALGANLVFTRLTGHGRSGAAMADTSLEAWMNDLAEALAVARRAGREVIVLSTSTGATLATIGALDPTLQEGIKGQVFISPNFGINSPAAVILTWPGVRWWGPLVAGAERSFTPQNDDHARYWSTRYPTVALMPMAAAVRHARALDVSAITQPLLAMFSDEDRVVSPDATRAVATLWGGEVRREIVRLGDGDDPYNHVIAGDILSPGQTDKTVTVILDWIAGL